MKNQSNVEFGKFGKERFPPETYQEGVGINARKLLQDNSKELTEVLIEHDVIKDDFKVFEMGAGPARNLYYIWEINNSCRFFCNDYSKESSFAHMAPVIKERVNFFEGDSEEIIKNNPMNDVDLFLVSDHFMHLQYDKANNIITEILNNWLPKYIMLREVKKKCEAPMHPRLYHNYSRFLESYDLLHESTSKQDDRYFIWLLKRK